MKITNEQKPILKKAVETCGQGMQVAIAIEEMAELIKELIKNARGGNNERHICEEVADVFIMLSQLEMMFDPQGGEIKKNIHNKMTRLKLRLNQLEKTKKEGAE